MKYYNVRRKKDGVRIAVVLCRFQGEAIRSAASLFKMNWSELECYEMRALDRMPASSVGDFVILPDSSHAVRMV